jgi:hypothetical protein
MTSNYLQQQEQVQKAKQILDQAYSYGITGNILSALESYANRFGKGNQTNIYSGYNNFNSGNTKAANELKYQIISQLEILKMSHTLYTKEYGKYDFPSNLSQSQMLQQINTWKMMVPLEDQKYYEAAINIIQGRPSQSFANELGKGGSINPSFLAETVGTIYEAHKVGQDALHHYQQTGQAPQMNLYSQNVGNPNINRTGAQEQQRRNERAQLDNLLDNVSNIMGKMGQQRNMNIYSSEYNSYSKQFIQLHNQFIQRYQLYWFLLLQDLSFQSTCFLYCRLFHSCKNINILEALHQ